MERNSESDADASSLCLVAKAGSNQIKLNDNSALDMEMWSDQR